jgi:hypothetical protein
MQISKRVSEYPNEGSIHASGRAISSITSLSLPIMMLRLQESSRGMAGMALRLVHREDFLSAAEQERGY